MSSHLCLAAVLDSSVNSSCEQELTLALLKFILALNASSSGIHFNFFFQFWSHWVFALAKQWLKLGFRHNVSEATEKDCLEMASSRMLRLTDVHCLRAFPAPLLYLAGFHNPLTSKGCVLMVAGREQWKSLPYTHLLEAFQWTSHCIWKCKGFGELHLEQKTKHNYLELPKTYQKFLIAFRRAVREFTWPIFLLFNGKKKWLPKGNIYFFVWEKKNQIEEQFVFQVLIKTCKWFW